MPYQQWVKLTWYQRPVNSNNWQSKDYSIFKSTSHNLSFVSSNLPDLIYIATDIYNLKANWKTGDPKQESLHFELSST